MSTFAEKLAAKKAAPRVTADVKILLAADLEAERDPCKESLTSPITTNGWLPSLRLMLRVKRWRSCWLPLVIRLSLSGLRSFMVRIGRRSHRSIRRARSSPLMNSTGITLMRQRLMLPGLLIRPGAIMGLGLRTAKRFRWWSLRRIENGTPGVNEWNDLLEAISGHEVAAIRNTVWGLNEYLPKMQLEAMGKAFGATARSEKN